MKLFDKYFFLLIISMLMIQNLNVEYPLKHRIINAKYPLIEYIETKTNLENPKKIELLSNKYLGAYKTKLKLNNNNNISFANDTLISIEIINKYRKGLLFFLIIKDEVKITVIKSLIAKENNLIKYNFLSECYNNINYSDKSTNKNDLIIKGKRKKNEYINNNLRLYKKMKLISDLEILLTIKGKNTQQILNNQSVQMCYNDNDCEDFLFNTKPSEILVNGIKTNIIDFYVYNLTLEENNIKIRFNKTLTNFNMMFYGLSNITYIEFKNSNSLQITNMAGMFYKCNNLISLVINDIDTSFVTNMNSMFNRCFNLISLDLSNFNTSSVINMGAMFKNCYNLISLDIKNFDTSLVTDFGHLFYNCSSLISLDLSNLTFLSGQKIFETFNGCSSKLLFCNIRTNNQILIDIISTYSFNNNSNCSDICFDKNKKIIYSSKSCSINCPETDKYEYKNICYSLCPKGTHNLTNNTCIRNSGINTDYIDYDIYTSYINDINFDINFELNGPDVISSNINFEKSESDIISSNLNFEKSESDIISSNINFELNKSDIISSYDKYFDLNETEIFSSDISLEMNELDIISGNIDDINFKLNETDIISFNATNISIISVENKSNISIYNQYNEYANNFINLITNLNYSSNDKDNIIIYLNNEIGKGNLDNFISNIIKKERNDITIDYKNIKIQLTSSDNQKNNQNNNISTINLGICEQKLKLIYNISNNDTLLIFKMDIYEDGLLIPIIEYNIFNIDTKEKLDLNICKDIKIDINIPVNIDENNLFKYNSSSEYYNDICSTYTTENNTDIILSDRKKEGVKNNMFLCENKCDLKEYNDNSKKVLCECEVKTKFSLVSEIKINKDEIFNNIKDIKNIINVNIMKCYHKLFKKEGIKNNIGNYIISIIILLNIFFCILFRIKGYNKLKNKINKIIMNKKVSNNKKEEKNYNQKKIVKIKKKKKKITKKKNSFINYMKTNKESNDKINKKLKLNYSSSLIKEQNNNYIYNKNNNYKNKRNELNDI